LNNGLVSQAVLIELYRFALLLSGRGDSAGRALDSVFSDCERGIAQIRDESHRVAWLVARLRQSFMAGASGSHESSVPARDDDSEIFDGDLPRDALILAPRFHALPEPERSALALFYLELFGPEQIAQVLGIDFEELPPILDRGRRLIESSLNPDFFNS
jgi:DNA-directed RNA polymerase specialized sigma24 family protein